MGIMVYSLLWVMQDLYIVNRSWEVEDLSHKEPASGISNCLKHPKGHKQARKVLAGAEGL